jgi:hypothetical protein
LALSFFIVHSPEKKEGHVELLKASFIIRAFPARQRSFHSSFFLGADQIRITSELYLGLPQFNFPLFFMLKAMNPRSKKQPNQIMNIPRSESIIIFFRQLQTVNQHQNKYETRRSQQKELDLP